MPGGVWGQQFRASQTGGYGAPRPNLLGDYDRANSWMRSGGSPSYYGSGSSAQQVRQFADVGKYNVNLLDPLNPARADPNYVPIDGDDGGPIGGINRYYDQSTPGGLFAGVLGAIGEKVTGALGQPELGSDIGTFLGKTIEAPLGIIGSPSIQGVPFLAPIIDAANSEIEKYTPYILRDTIKIPKDVGGAFMSMLSIFSAGGTALERTYAGLGNRGDLPEDIQARIDSGELTHDKALDEMVLSARGYSDNPMHNMIWSILLDPANWASLGVGAVGGAVRGTIKVGTAFSGAVRAGEAGTLARVAAGSQRLQDIAEVAKAGGQVLPEISGRSTLAEMRGAIDNPRARLQLGIVERMGMSALGPVSAETGNTVARVGNYILRATDPSSFFSGSKAGMRSMGLISTASATGAIAGYGALTINTLGKIADDVTNGGSDAIYRAVGVNGSNTMQEVALSELATDAMKSGVIPRTGTLTPPEAVRELLRGGAYDANIGKYVEMLVEKNKDVSVGLLPEKQMYDETVAKFAEMLGVTPDEVAKRMKSVNSEEAVAIHALYYYFKGEKLHTTVADAIRAAQQAGTLAKGIDADTIAIVSPKSVTEVSVKEIEAAVKTGDVALIRLTVERFNNFNWLHTKNVADKDLIAVVNNWLDSHKGYHIKEMVLKDAKGDWLPGVPEELRKWAMNAETHGYKLGQRMPVNVPEEDLWRITRHPDGTILNADPYSDFWAEGQNSAQKINRFNAIRMAMTRSIRQEKVVYQQRRAFITGMAKAESSGGINVPPALAERIFRSIMYEAKDRYLQPRGLEPREMYTAARKVLDEVAGQSDEYADIAKRLTERQIVLSLLRATQGDVKLVGLTQKVTGGIKAYAPGSSANYWGRISERLFPLMRFTLNPIFQTMELTEPYVLLAMRGIKLPLRRDSEGYQSALASRNGYNQLIRLTESDADGLAAETAEALAIQSYQRTESNAKFGRQSWWGRWTPHVGERKDAALALQTRRLLGDNLYNAFKEIKGDSFEAYWADLAYEYGTHNRGLIAERWLATNFGVTNMDGHTVVVFDDILKSNSIGKRFRITPDGALGSYTWADVEKVLDNVNEANGKLTKYGGTLDAAGEVMKPGEALQARLKNISLEEWLDEIKDVGINSDSVTRITDTAAHDIWKMANGPELDDFWQGEKLPGGGRKDGFRGVFLQGVTGTDPVWTRLARDTEIARARVIVQGWAQAKGMTEEEFIKLHADDIPRPLDPTAIAPEALTEIRGQASGGNYKGWAEQALEHGPKPVAPTRLEEVHYAFVNFDPHPAKDMLAEVEMAGEHIMLRVELSGLELLQESVRDGFPADVRGLPTKGYTSATGIMADAHYADVVLRVRKDALPSGTHPAQMHGMEYLSKTDIAAEDLEMLTDEGWQPVISKGGGRVAPPEPRVRLTNSEVRTARDIYRYNMPESGITELDLRDILWTDSEKKSKNIYVSSDHRVINGWLRGDDPNDMDAYFTSSLTEQQLEWLRDDLDQAILKGQIREPMVLYRGLPLSRIAAKKPAEAKRLRALKPGDPYTDTAFFSSSEDIRTAHTFAGTDEWSGDASTEGIIMTVQAPAGMHAALLASEGEGEYLFGRDIVWTVIERKVVTKSTGTTIHLTIVPESSATKPGVRRLGIGDPAADIAAEGRFLEDAMNDPDGLRAMLANVPEDEVEQVSADIETAIAKAEMAGPKGEAVTIGGHSFGPKTVDGLLEDITSAFTPDQITTHSQTIPEVRGRLAQWLESRQWTPHGEDEVRKVEEFNDDKALVSLAEAIAEHGGFRFGLRRVLQTMERFWALGTSGVTGKGADDVVKRVATNWARGTKYGIRQQVMTNKASDLVDAVFGNTSRRSTGRTGGLQPILHTDSAAEAAGFFTPSAYADLYDRGLLTPGTGLAAPAATPNMSGRIFKPGEDHATVVLPGNDVPVGAPFGAQVRGTFDEPDPAGITTAGVLIQEADGRVWIYEPLNHFGGYEHTWPKGRPDVGEDLRDAALREAQEEMGFTVELTGYVGDFDNVQGTSRARFYTARRTGGGPALGDVSETAAIKLVPPQGARDMLIHDGIPDARDQAILEALEGLAPSQPVRRVEKPGLDEALAASPLRGSIVPQRDMSGTNVTSILEDSGLGTDHIGEPNGFKMVRDDKMDAWYAFAYDETGRPVAATQVFGHNGKPWEIGGVTNVVPGRKARKGFATQLYDWIQDETDINLYPLTGIETTPKGFKFSSRWLAHRKALAEAEPPAAAAAPAVPPTSPPIPTGPTTRVKALQGTTGPVLVEDPATGLRYVEKRGAGLGHVTEELTADKVYAAAGAPAAKAEMVGPVKRAEYIEGGQTLDQLWDWETGPLPGFEEAKAQLQQDFAVDAWLANWDVIGLEGDNIVVKDGVAYRIDNGGALRYRAQGAPKSTMHPTPSLTAPEGGMWGPEVSEINKMRSGGNEWQRRIFGDLPDEEVARQVIELGEKLDTLLAEIPEELHPLMRQRYADMVRQMEGITPAPGRIGPVGPTLPGNIQQPLPLSEYSHEWLTKFYNDAATKANEVGFNGKSTWTAAEMSALAGLARDRMVGREGGAISLPELDRGIIDVHVAVTPGGPGTDLADLAPVFELLAQKRYRAQKQKILRHGSSTVHEGLRDKLGAIVEQSDEVGVGLFDGENPSPLMSHFLLNTPEHGQSLADSIAFITGQPVVRMWTPGPHVSEITDFKSVTARVNLVLPASDLTPRMAERIAEAIGKRWPEVDDMIAVRGADRSWHLQIKDRDGKLLPRTDNGAVDVDALHVMLEDMLSGDDFKVLDDMAARGENPGLVVDYGHVYETKPPTNADGSIDWDGYRTGIETASTANGTPIRGSDLDDIRTTYNDTIRLQTNYAAPFQSTRAENGLPLVGRSLHDERGGNILGTTTPGSPGPGGRTPTSAVIHGLAASDPLTGLHELIHIFSIAGMDPSMKTVISQAFDEFHVGNDAAKTARLAILKTKLAATTHNRGGAQKKLTNQINALEHGLRDPHPSEWGRAHEEFFVDLMWEWIRKGTPPQNPDLANAFDHFRNWLDITQKEMNQPGMVPITISPQMQATLNKMFARPGRETVSYSVEQQTLRMAGQQALRSSMDEAHTTQFYKKDRSMVERSINHPYIGLYPASYMWGKILPEMLRFLALRPFGMETPFLMWNVAREVSDSVSSQAELDEGFKKFLADNEDAFMLFSMMFPGLPHDIPANASLPIRRIAEQGIEHQQAFARGATAETVGDIDFGKGAMDAVQYAVGPLGTIRTVTEVAGMGGDFARSLAGEVLTDEDSELLSLR